MTQHVTRIQLFLNVDRTMDVILSRHPAVAPRHYKSLNHSNIFRLRRAMQSSILSLSFAPAIWAHEIFGDAAHVPLAVITFDVDRVVDKDIFFELQRDHLDQYEKLTKAELERATLNRTVSSYIRDFEEANSERNVWQTKAEDLQESLDLHRKNDQLLSERLVELRKALQLVANSDPLVNWLEDHDPQALHQIRRALVV